MEPNQELENFVRETLRQVDAGLGETYKPKDVVRFEVAISKSTDKEGKLGIKVLEAGAKITSEVASKVMFEAVRDFKKHPSYEEARNNTAIRRQRRSNFE